MTDREQNTQGVADEDSTADTASGGSPEAPSTGADPTTDEDGTPVDNPSGG